MTARRTDWQEGDLRFDFSKAMNAVKFDSRDHGLTHLGLKPIDFVVEWSDQFWLIEVKDPENSNIPRKHQSQQRQDFLKNLQSGTLVKEHLFPKFRDSMIYLGMDRGIPDKPMHYMTLICLSSLEPVILTYVAESLFRKEWLQGPKNGWSKGFSVKVFNLLS